MNKIILPALCGILLSFSAKAQNGWLPPVIIPTGTDLCDNTPWKLVFYDGFDGTSLSDQWHKFASSWSGVPDSDNWDQSHGIRNDNHLYKDENVIVENGICRLLVKNEHYTWQCPGCSISDTIIRDFTTGYIETPFHLNAPSTAPADENWYNAGKFEAKIKYPVFPGSWSCFWLLNGYGGVNEIDISEATIKGTSPSTQQDWPKNYCNLHDWGPKELNDPIINPYHLPKDTGLALPYPNQNWWNLIFFGNYFNQGDWHTYTCEWDTAVLKLYVDHHNAPWATVWKYNHPRHTSIRRSEVYLDYYDYLVYSDCNPDAGTWHITVGFPYNNESRSNIRISSGLQNDYTSRRGVFTLGEVDVDYVMAWQRHPEGAHEDLCDIADPVLTGPPQVCDGAEFTAVPAIPGGYWSCSPQVGMNSNWIAGGAAHAVFHGIPATPYSGGWVQYNYSGAAEGCPLLNKRRYASCNFNKAVPVMVVQSRVAVPGNDFGQFRLFAPEDIYMPDEEAAYTWDLDYATGTTDFSKARHVRLLGRYAATEYFPCSDTTTYCVRWNLKIALPGGDTTIRQGERYSYSAYGRQSTDTNLYFADALITDSAAYQQAVYKRVAQTFMATDADTVAICSMIERVRDQELAPYIIYPDTTILPMSYSIPNPKDSPDVMTGSTRLYPNPVDDLLFIAPGGRFITGQVQVHIYSLSARMMLSQEKTYIAEGKLEVPLRGLNNGLYILELQQDAYRELYKFVKVKK